MKIELAKERKESLQKEKIVKKNEKVVDYFKKHWAIREEAHLRDVKLHQLSEKLKEESRQVILRFIHSLYFKDLEKKRKILKNIFAIETSNAF